MDIFFREVQRSWRELFPFADERDRRAAHLLGLSGDAPVPAGRITDADEFVRLVGG